MTEREGKIDMDGEHRWGGGLSRKRWEREKERDIHTHRDVQRKAWMAGEKIQRSTERVKYRN